MTPTPDNKWIAVTNPQVPGEILYIEQCEVVEAGQRIYIPAAIIEFHAGGNTIWIQSPEGATTMRIKCTGRIIVEQCRDSPVSHCDILVQGDINFCISKDAQ